MTEHCNSNIFNVSTNNLQVIIKNKTVYILFVGEATPFIPIIRIKNISHHSNMHSVIELQYVVAYCWQLNYNM